MVRVSSDTITRCRSFRDHYRGRPARSERELSGRIHRHAQNCSKVKKMQDEQTGSSSRLDPNARTNSRDSSPYNMSLLQDALQGSSSRYAGDSRSSTPDSRRSHRSDNSQTSVCSNDLMNVDVNALGHLSSADKRKVEWGQWFTGEMGKLGMDVELHGAAAVSIMNSGGRGINDLDFQLVSVDGRLPKGSPFMDTNRFGYDKDTSDAIDVRDVNAQLGAALSEQGMRITEPFTFNKNSIRMGHDFSPSIKGEIEGVEISIKSVRREQGYPVREVADGLPQAGRRTSIMEKASAIANRSNIHISEGKILTDMFDLALTADAYPGGYDQLNQCSPEVKGRRIERLAVMRTPIIAIQLFEP